MPLTIFEDYHNRRNEIAFQVLGFVKEMPEFVAATVAERLMNEGKHEATEEEIQEAVVLMLEDAYLSGADAGVNEPPAQVDLGIPKWVVTAMNKVVNYYVRKHYRKEHKNGETEQQSD